MNHWIKRLVSIGVLIVVASPAWAANVRVSHLAPNAPSVDVYLNGQRSFTDVPFRAVTAYLDIPNGRYDVSVYATGTQQKPILEASGVEFRNDLNYTITAAGFGPEKSQRPAVFVDDIVPNASFARLRIINASPDIPSLELAIRDGLPLLTDVGFKVASVYLRFGPGLFDLELRIPGLTPGAMALPTLRLEAGKVYTVFVVGSRLEGTLNYVLTEDRLN